jgi:hypothetical protein
MNRQVILPEIPKSSTYGRNVLVAEVDTGLFLTSGNLLTSSPFSARLESVMEDTRTLLDKAAQARRLAHGVSDPVSIRCLVSLAEEYERQATETGRAYGPRRNRAAK